MRLKKLCQFWRLYRSAAASSLIIAALSFAGYKLHFNSATIVLLYLLVIVLQSLAGGFVPSMIVVLAAGTCLDFFFFPPLLSMRVADPFNLLALFVFLTIACVVTWLVSRMRAEARRAELHATEVEQLYDVARRLLLLEPNGVDGVPALEVFRDVLGAGAVCLFDASTAEIVMDGISECGLQERTRQAYIFGKDADATTDGVLVRCLRIRNVTTGAIGFEGLPNPEVLSPAFSVLAAAALERAHTFRRASRETAAAQAEVFRTAILDALAHEFKTPLATILAVIGGIRASRKLETDQEEMADMVEFEVTRLSRLTTRLLSTARLDRDELKPMLKPIDVVPFVECVVHRYMTQSQERRVTVTSCGASVKVPADRQLLELALTQLLDNALKYSLLTSTITVSVQAEEGFITTSVRNEGNSIAANEKDRIFERFYRGARVRNLVSGTGLGLYVARKIAAAHGGSLYLRDEGSRDVVFCLKLPTLHYEHPHLATTH